MTRLQLATLILVSHVSLAHAHEIETHVSGYGLGPFGLNVGLELTEHATFTLGIEGFYASSQAEGFSASRVGGAGIPLGFKIYLGTPEVDRVVPHIRVLGVIGVAGDTYEGRKSVAGIFGAFAGVGASYFVREALGIGTEAGVGYLSRHGTGTDDRVATFTWRMTLVFRFGDSHLANPSSPADHGAQSTFEESS